MIQPVGSDLESGSCRLNLNVQATDVPVGLPMLTTSFRSGKGATRGRSKTSKVSASVATPTKQAGRKGAGRPKHSSIAVKMRKADALRRDSHRKKKVPPKPPAPTVKSKRVFKAKLEEYCRTLIPGYDPWEQSEGCYFDIHAAIHAVEFFHQRLRHAKGTKAREPFNLEPWQQALVGNLWGWKRDDTGFRRYRRAMIEVGRKNGKTPLAAGLVLLLLCEDGEFGAEVYGAASEYRQASLVFEHARMMVLFDDQMKDMCQIFKGQSKAIQLDESWGFSTYRPIVCDADSAQGFNTHGAVVDELHTQPNRGLVDALETSTAARRQPLLIYITTSDYERPDSICNEIEEYGIKVREGIIHDSEFLPVIYKCDKKDDWHDEKVWRKANPNIGVSVGIDYLRTAHKKACEIPSFENTFKRLHLNLRTETDIRYVDMDAWDECGDAMMVDPEKLKGRKCYAGLDLAAVSDSNAFVLMFPEPDGGFQVLAWFWVPDETVRLKRDKTPYVDFVARGEIRTTPGEEISYQQIRKEINEIASDYKIHEIAVDRYFQGGQLTQELMHEDGFKMIDFPPTHAAMAAPCSEMENLIAARKLYHGGNRVMRWMASNAIACYSREGNVKIDRSKSTAKVDGMVAMVMALGRAIQDKKPAFGYSKDRGFSTL